MSKIRVNLIFLLCLSTFSFIRADGLSNKINKLLKSQDEIEQNEIIKQIIEKQPSVDDLINTLKNIEFAKPDKFGVILKENQCVDGIARPYFLYVPQNYDHKTKMPLIVYLHGGVSRKDLINNKEFADAIREHPFTKMADEYGYLLIFPLGQSEATWWDSVGISNVLQQIRNTKQDYNIDDNRIFMTGFSDGGSGSFLFAMCYPTDFAGFLPLNGHPGVGSEAGEIQAYFVNLFNRPIYVVNTDEDALYPAEKEIRPTMELAHKAGAHIFYRIYAGIGHDFDYAEEEMPRMARFMESNSRSLNPTIKWESAYPGLGCTWLVIDAITEEGHADWYEDHNMKLIEDRVMFGFYADDEYEGLDPGVLDKSIMSQYFPDEDYKGPGVRIDKIIGDSTLCAMVGMEEGDVIIKLGDIPVRTIEDVSKYKEGKECGDSAEIVILRENQILEFEGYFPGPTEYDLFTRGKPSCRIEGYFSANKFSFRTSQVGAFTLYIHPDMVQLDQNVVVEVNGEIVFDEKVEVYPEFILRNFLENRDRALIYVNKVAILLK